MRARNSRSIRISSTCCARTSRASRWHERWPLRRPCRSRSRRSRWSTIRAGSADTSYPSWAAADAPNGEVSSRRYQEARRIRHYVQHDDMRFVHLVDGGLADNLGLRSLYDKTTLAGGFVAFLELTGYTRFRRVLHLVVNAQQERSAEGAEDEGVPGPIETVRGATKLTLDRYSFETVENFRRDMGGWMQELQGRSVRAGSRPDVAWALRRSEGVLRRAELRTASGSGRTGVLDELADLVSTRSASGRSCCRVGENDPQSVRSVSGFSAGLGRTRCNRLTRS